MLAIKNMGQCLAEEQGRQAKIALVCRRRFEGGTKNGGQCPREDFRVADKKCCH
jgi:hypothetical protein